MSVKLLVGILLFVVSCTSLQNHDDRRVQVKVPERLHFSGKGAGAGMMLMSSLGAAGIAIGVAIDEGIAKDIAATLNTASVNVTTVFDEQLQAVLATYAGGQRHSIIDAIDTVAITRYGFLLQAGRNDPVAGWLHIDVLLHTGASFVVRFPEDITPSSAMIKTAPLAVVKRDATTGESLLRDAARLSAHHIVSHIVRQ